MSVIKDLSDGTTNKKVRDLLERHPITRDNDKLLWLAFCCEHKGLKEVIGKNNYTAFKSWLLKKDVPMFESLSRARRKIQEEEATLRGKGYENRHAQAEEVRQWSLL